VTTPQPRRRGSAGGWIVLFAIFVVGFICGVFTTIVGLAG
jgi:hypothetical protein